MEEKEFEVLEVNDKGNRFQVKIEIDGELKSYSFQYGQRWEKERDGVPRYILHIQQDLKRLEKALEQKPEKVDLEKQIGKKFKLNK